jgi:hypothetical protein
MTVAQLADDAIGLFLVYRDNYGYDAAAPATWPCARSVRPLRPKATAPGRLLPAALLPRRPQPRRAPRTAARRPHSPRRTRPGGPHRPGPRPGLPAANAAGHHRRTRPSAWRRAARARKARLLAPMPRIGEINLAQVVAEAGPILDRAGDVEQASAECGAAPVTRASRKGRTVTFRWAASTQARNALHTFASNSRQLTLGGQALRRCPPARQAPPPRRSHPWPRLAPGHVGLLAQPPHLRPSPTWRREAPRRLNLTQGTQAHGRSPAVPSSGAASPDPVTP